MPYLIDYRGVLRQLGMSGQRLAEVRSWPTLHDPTTLDAIPAPPKFPHATTRDEFGQLWDQRWVALWWRKYVAWRRKWGARHADLLRKGVAS